MTGPFSLIILRDWTRHRLRLVLTTAGIALGVAVFFAIQTANSSLVVSLNQTIEKMAGRATLQVAGGEAGFSQEYLNDVRETAGVQIAEPVTETLVSTSADGGQRILVLGLDTASELTLYNETIDQSSFVVKNPLAFSNRKDSVAVTRKLADRLTLKDGDKLTVYAQTGPVELTVRGIFSETGIGEVYDGNVAVMDIYSAQEIFGRGSRIDRIDIANSPDVTVDDLQRSIEARLPTGINAVRPNLRGESLENSVSALHVGFTIMSFLALTIAIFIIFNSFSISLNQRWKEIAILRAIGVEAGNIKRMFLAEALVLGLIGSAIGLGAGYLMAAAAMQTVTGIAATVYGFTASSSDVNFDPLFAAIAFTLGVTASLIAAWLPARAASKLEPALALRNIETRQPDSKTGRLRIATGVGLIIAGLVLTRITPPAVGSYIQISYSFGIQLGVILLLPTIVEMGARLLRPIMNYIFGAEGVIAIETMARSPRRSVATIGAIVIGLSFVYSNAALIHSQRSAINRSIDKAIAADMLVTSSEQLHSKTYHFTESTARTIRSLPEVEIADELRVTSTELNGAEVTILAHDMRAYFEISPDLLDVGDPVAAREATAKGEGILVSNNFSFRTGIGLGDTFTIATPRGDLKLPVVGMLDYYRSEQGTIFLDRSVYKQYWEDTDVDYVFIDLKPGVDRTVFKEKVQAAIAGTQRAFIYTHEEYKSWVSRLIDQFFLLMYMQMIVAILVAAIGLVNTMLISVAERQRELGIFRAIGGLRRQVVKMVLLEAVAISLIGFITGAATGALNAYFLVNTAAKVVAGFTLHLTIPYFMIAVSIPLVLLIAVLSAWLPARRAARLRVVDAIGYE